MRWQPFAVLALSFVARAASAQGVSVAQTGYLLDANDDPVNGTLALTFAIHATETGGTPLWTGDDGAGHGCPVAIARGYYAVLLGAAPAGCGTGLTSSVFDAGSPRWLEVTVGNVPMTPRQVLSSVPTAQVSADAQALKAALVAGGGTLNDGANPVDWTRLKSVPSGLATVGALGGGNALLGVNAAGTASEFKTIAGTTNRVSVSHGAGTITLSTPQDLHAGASPTFAGLSLTGALNLPADPSTSLQASTKGYVDTKFAAGVTAFNTRSGAVTLGSGDVTGALGFTPINRAGDTMTGALTLPGDPTANLQAATKAYVDAKAVGDITDVVAGTGLTGGASAGAATLAVNFAGSGSLNTAARSDHTHATWGLFAQENYSVAPTGWTTNTVTQCGTLNVLGGYGTTSTAANVKTFTGLPAHTAVRVVLDYHFIDSWDGEYGLVLLDDVERWRYLRSNCCTGAPNVCGNGTYPDVMGTTVELEIPHTASTLKVSVGSTLDSVSTDESYGFSNFRIYTR